MILAEWFLVVSPSHHVFSQQIPSFNQFPRNHLHKRIITRSSRVVLGGEEELHFEQLQTKLHGCVLE